jgi:outer membrane protein, multidrug efflux system
LSLKVGTGLMILFAKWPAPAFALLVTAILAGCAAEAPREGHRIVLAERFDGASRPIRSDLSRWWARFGSKALNNLVQQAERGNLDLAAAVARIEQADAQARVAGAALLPVLTASADGARSQQSGTTSGRISQPNIRNSVSGVLAASYELDIWGRNRDHLLAAEAQREASVYALEVVRLTTLAGTVNAYLQLAAAQDRLAIASENLRSAERVLQVIRERLAAGTAASLDRAQQEGLVATQRAAIPPLRQSAELARTTLALLLGRPPEGFRLAGTSLRLLRTPAIAAGLPAALLLNRPDIRNAERLLAGADANLDAARKALLPSIQLTGQGGLQSAALHTLLRPESAIWSLAAGLTQPIFDGGRLQGQVDLAAGQRRELLETYRKTIVSALIDVENALVAVRESAARASAQAVVVAKAREAFGFSEQRFREGTIDLQTLLNTQTTLFQAQDTLVQAQLARLQAGVSLAQALGGDFTVHQPIDSLFAKTELASTAPVQEQP